MTIIYLLPGIAAGIMQPTRPAIVLRACPVRTSDNASVRGGQLFWLNLFGLTPRRDCRVSHHPALSSAKMYFEAERAGLLVSVALIRPALLFKTLHFSNYVQINLKLYLHNPETR